MGSTYRFPSPMVWVPQDVVREAENNSVPPLAWPQFHPFQEVAPELVAECPLAKSLQASTRIQNQQTTFAGDCRRP